MFVDKILNFKYSDDFEWEDSVIYSFLSEYYGVCDVKLSLRSGDEIIIKKYNVVGGSGNREYISIYESNGVNEPLLNVDLEDIKSLEVI